MIDLHALRQDITNGGDPDLYRGVRKQLPFPVPLDPEVDDTFMRLAGTVSRLHPDRTDIPVQNPYAARLVVMEFCGHPHTTLADVLTVLDASTA